MQSVFLFEFEKNHPNFSSLEWIPLCVRYYLDGVPKKLSLGSWQSFPYQVRQDFVNFAIQDQAYNVQKFLSMLLEANVQYNGSQLKEAILPDTSSWENTIEVPAYIQEQCVAFDCTLSQADWGKLNRFLRYTFHKAATGRDGSLLPKLLKELGYAET